MDEEAKKYHKTSVGGQALIEGIMMRGPKGSAMAVRLPNGEIETTYKNVKPWRDKCKFFGVPLIRGIVGFVESLVTGYGYLMESAEKSTQGLTEDEQDMSKFDRWLNDRFGPQQGRMNSAAPRMYALFPQMPAANFLDESNGIFCPP